jgi:cytochrome c-type biogenesis protein CcmF
LQAWYLFAAGYAGQEGSFMLWTLWVAVLGVALSAFGRRKGMESEIMVFYSLILVFLLLLLVIKNPFAYVWETFAKDGVAEGFVPQNGKGLNPLLHNVWITIHPPILFTGFAAMSAPFALAMAGLLKRDYQDWVKHALPWTLYSTAILGFGIMLGGSLACVCCFGSYHDHSKEDRRSCKNKYHSRIFIIHIGAILNISYQKWSIG